MRGLLFIVFLFVGASTLWAEDRQNQVKAFKSAYQQYQKLIDDGRRKEALPFAKEAYELGKVLYGEESKSYAALSYNYADALLINRDEKEASKILKETLKLYKKLYGDDGEELIDVYINLAEANVDFHDPTPQKRYYGKALSITEKHYGKENHAYGQLLIKAGAAILSKANVVGGERYLRQARDLYSKIAGPDHPMAGIASFWLGKYELSKKKRRRAEKHFLHALSTFEHPEKPSNHLEMSTHAFLVTVYEESNQSDKATEHCLAIGRMSPVKDTQDYEPLYQKLPKYPQSAARVGKEGFVILEFTVDEYGFVKEPVVVEAEGGRSFEEEALKAAKGYRYAPAFENGVAVSTKGVMQKITFELAK